MFIVDLLFLKQEKCFLRTSEKNEIRSFLEKLGFTLDEESRTPIDYIQMSRVFKMGKDCYCEFLYGGGVERGGINISLVLPEKRKKETVTLPQGAIDLIMTLIEEEEFKFAILPFDKLNHLIN